MATTRGSAAASAAASAAVVDGSVGGVNQIGPGDGLFWGQCHKCNKVFSLKTLYLASLKLSSLVCSTSRYELVSSAEGSFSQPSNVGI